MKTTTTAEQFFYEHAGYSYDLKTETPEQGRARCAASLAQAEKEARERGFSFEWSIDQTTDSSDFSDEEPRALWECLCRDENGVAVGSLSGIDFGRDGQPWGDPYRRVVEAEVASEAL